MRTSSLSFLLLILCHSHWCTPSKILAVFYFPSYSHFVLGEAVCKGLAAKGHNVTMVSSFPQKTPIENYTDITLNGISYLKEILENIKYNYSENSGWSLAEKFKFTNDLGYELVQHSFKEKSVQDLMKSGEQFDLVILENFVSEALFGFCHFFKAPCVAVATVSSSLWSNRLTGNVALASYIPDIFTHYNPEMGFFQRFNNLITLLHQELYFHWIEYPRHDELMRKYIPNAPDLRDLMYNVSLIFLNSHPAISSSVPVTPNMIHVGGVHMQQGDDKSRISESVKKFLDDHNEGVIYFAFGSLFKSNDLPFGIRQAIIGAFKRWNKPILWKFDGDLPDKPNNVKIEKWLPQPAVLAHKNVIAFITHCGRLSIIESVYSGVPMIGVPIFAEQEHNAREMEYLGYAITIDYLTINADNLYNALVEITSNPRYSREAKLRSEALKKFNVLKEAIFWIEHILKFKDVSYLKNAGTALPWYKFWMLDILAFIITFILLLKAIVCFAMRKILYKLKNIDKQLWNNHKIKSN